MSKQYKYEELFDKLLKVVKKSRDRRLDCLFVTEFIQVKIGEETRNMRVIDILKEFNIKIPSSCIYIKQGKVMLFRGGIEKSKPAKKEKKENVVEL
jgi:hypothetical protein